MDPQENFNRAVGQLQTLMVAVFFVFILLGSFLVYLLNDQDLSGLGFGSKSKEEAASRG